MIEARLALIPIAYDPHFGDAGKIAAAVIAGIDESGAAAALNIWHAAEAKGGSSAFSGK